MEPARSAQAPARLARLSAPGRGQRKSFQECACPSDSSCMKCVLLLIASLPFLAGCHSDKVLHPDGLEVLITNTHVHSRYCGHYFYDGHWYYLPQHKHGVNCGHELVDGIWVLKG